MKKPLTSLLSLMSIFGLFAPLTTQADSILQTEQGVLSHSKIRQQEFVDKRAKVAAEVKAKAEEKAKAEAEAKAKAEEAANPYVSRSEAAKADALENALSSNMYPVGQCTWGVKELAPWAHTYWGNGGQWAASAEADGFTIGTVPVVGAIAVWTDPYGGYGHVAYVTAVNNEQSIEVLEANVGGNPNIANYRGFFDPTNSALGVVSYIYPAN